MARYIRVDDENFFHLPSFKKGVWRTLKSVGWVVLGLAVGFAAAVALDTMGR